MVCVFPATCWKLSMIASKAFKIWKAWRPLYKVLIPRSGGLKRLKHFFPLLGGCQKSNLTHIFFYRLVQPPTSELARWETQKPKGWISWSEARICLDSGCHKLFRTPIPKKEPKINQHPGPPTKILAQKTRRLPVRVCLNITCKGGSMMDFMHPFCCDAY